MTRSGWSTCCLCFSLATSCSAQHTPVTAAPAGSLDVVRYEASLTLDVATRSLSGETTVVFVRSPGLREARFPIHDLTIEQVTSAAQKLAFRVEHQQLIVPLATDTSTRINVRYHGTPTRGLVFGKNYVYSDFDTCHWLICVEEPGDKAEFQLELRLPQAYQVVASGRQVSRSQAPDGQQRSLWFQSRPYSSYLFGFAAGEFTELAQQFGASTFRYLGLSLAPDALLQRFADSGRMLDFLQEKAGVPLPVDVYTQVLVPGSQAQEKSSFSLIGREELDPILEDPHEDWVLLHELSHQWWGNLITCQSWQHFWLNEALATFMVAAYKEQRWGKSAYDRELTLFAERRKLAAQAGFDVPLAYSGSYPSPRIKRAIVYAKGALFLHVLRESLGDARFWAGLRLYTQRHAGGLVVSRDFQSALEQSSGRQLTALFDAWVYEHHGPGDGAP